MKIEIGETYFKRELEAYSNWREAFARELLQNSIDAEANDIFVDLSVANGLVSVVVEDDGHGMSRDKFKDVFMVLGETTKAGEGKIGGFGRARILLCFGQEQYRVESLDWAAAGRGAHCSLAAVDEYRCGTRFEITTRDRHPLALQRAFERVLADSDIAASVFLDVEGVNLDAEGVTPLRIPNWRRTLSDATGHEWAKVTVVPSSGQYSVDRCIVRVKGLQTFHYSLLRTAGEDLVVEIAADRSREVLTVSRDALRYPYAAQLNELRDTFLTNRTAALRPDTLPIRRVIRGGGALIFEGGGLCGAQKPGGAQPSGSRVVVESGPKDDAEELGKRVARLVTTAGDTAFVGSGQERGPAAVGGSAMLPFDIPTERVSLGFDCAVFAESDDPRVRRWADEWSPKNWTHRRDAGRLALLLMWKASVEVALDALRSVRPTQPAFPWNVGWYFGDPEAVAVCLGSSDEGAFMLLNPVDASGGFRYARTGDPATWRALAAAAVHEVAHVPAGHGHDERFSSLLTSLYAEIDHEAALRRIAAAAIPPPPTG